MPGGLKSVMYCMKDKAWTFKLTKQMKLTATNLMNIRKKFSQIIIKTKRRYHKDILSPLEENYYKTNTRDYFKNLWKTTE